MGEGCGGESSEAISTPLSEPSSDPTSFLYSSLDLQSNASPDQEGATPTTADSNLDVDPLAPPQGTAADTDTPVAPSGIFKDMECQAGAEQLESEKQTEDRKNDSAGRSEEVKPDVAPEVVTPDVDLLLECTFSYMQASEEPEPMEGMISVFTDPADHANPSDFSATGPTHAEALDLPIRPLGYTPSPEPSPSPSSDEEDIYGHGLPASASSDRLRDGLDALNLQGTKQNAQEESRLHKDQVSLQIAMMSPFSIEMYTLLYCHLGKKHFGKAFWEVGVF